MSQVKKPKQKLSNGDRYFYRSGKPIKGKNAVIKWAKLFEDGEKRIIRQTRVGVVYKKRMLYEAFFVSTVFLGLDHAFGLGSKPLIFETMIFCQLPFGNIGCEAYMNRYSTEKEALIGHVRALALIKTPRFVLSHIWHEHIRRNSVELRRNISMKLRRLKIK